MAQVNRKKIGLVLSGGGAKGAYEIGVWRALETLGVTDQIDGIIGSSVGALNAVLLDSCGLEKAAELWENLKQSDLLHISQDKSYKVTETQIAPMNKADYPRLSAREPEQQRLLQLYRSVLMLRNEMPKDFLLQLATNAVHSGIPLTQEKLNELIVKNIRFDALHREIYAVCTESMSPWNTAVFRLADYTPDEQRRIILASSAIPVVYEGSDGVRIRGKGYFDGGMRANTPCRQMYERGWRNLITVWLDHRAKPEEFPDAEQIDLIPPYSLGGHLGTIWVNRSKKMLDQFRGYYDTMQQREKLSAMAARVRAAQ